MNLTATTELDEPSASPAILQSREYCARLTREAAKNFYYGLKLLPEPKRSAMFALYAYMRLVDDIADEEDGRSVAERVRDLNEWKHRTHAVISAQHASGANDSHPVWPAFAEIARRYDLPAKLFDDAIAGQQHDLSPVTFETFDQLHNYCYQVAGVVGLASIRIWGYDGGAETEAMAVARGVAFQITNIVRDLREDTARGRLYLPREELAAVAISEQELLDCVGNSRGVGVSPAHSSEATVTRSPATTEKFCALVCRLIARVETFYEQSADLESRLEPDSRPTMVAMTEIYRGLLAKIAADPQRVLRERVSLSLIHKLRIGWKATRAVRRGVRE